MNTAVSEFSVGKYKVLKLDEKMVDTSYTKYEIDGKQYEPVPIYDAPNCIAVESNDIFIEKNIKYID